MFNLILGTVIVLSAPYPPNGSGWARDAAVVDTETQVTRTIISPHRTSDGTKIGELKSYIYSYRPHSKTSVDTAYELTKVINQEIPPKYGLLPTRYYMFGGYMLEVKFHGTIRYNEHVELWPMSIDLDLTEPDYQRVNGKLSMYEFIHRQNILDETCDLDRYFYDRHYNNISGMVFKYERNFDFVNELNAHINACIVGYYDKSDFTYHKTKALRLLTYLKAFPAYYKNHKQEAMISINQLITIFEKQLHEIHIDTTCTNWDKFGTCGLANYRAY